jgi:hypothetical protein
MAQIEVRCPLCKRKGMIEVEENALKSISRGLLAVNIEINTICPHSFITYIDRNLKIRDYFIADFQVELPEMALVEKVDEDKSIFEELINLDLIKLNLPATLIANILKSIFYRKSVIIISEDQFINTHIFNFLKYITQNSFKIDINLISMDEYQSNRKNYRKSIVLDGVNIINNVDKILDPKKMKVEKNIVQKFMLESNLSLSLILLKNEVQKIYKLSQEMVQIIKNREEGTKINTLKISKQLETQYNIKISSEYLDFLTNVVKNYFEIDVPSISASFLNSI